MVVLGVVLVLLALAVGILLVAGVASLEGTVDVAVPGGTLSFPPLTFLVTGMVVISVFWLGWVVLRTGVRHSRRRHAEAKEAAKEAETKRVAEEERLKEEFAARERQLIEERRRHDSETAELKRGAAGSAAAGSAPTGSTAAGSTAAGSAADSPDTQGREAETAHDPQDPTGAKDDEDPKSAGRQSSDGNGDDVEDTDEDGVGTDTDSTPSSGSVAGSSPVDRRTSGHEGEESGTERGKDSVS